MAQVQFLPGNNFFLLYSVQTGSEAHPAFYPMGTADSVTKVKHQGHQADHSPPSSAEAKKGGAIAYLHSPICLHGIVLT
jgi:hypothetical protein